VLTAAPLRYTTLAGGLHLQHYMSRRTDVSSHSRPVQPALRLSSAAASLPGTKAENCRALSTDYRHFISYFFLGRGLFSNQHIQLKGSKKRCNFLTFLPPPAYVGEGGNMHPDLAVRASVCDRTSHLSSRRPFSFYGTVRPTTDKHSRREPPG